MGRRRPARTGTGIATSRARAVGAPVAALVVFATLGMGDAAVAGTRAASGPRPLDLTSAAFDEGGDIPIQHSCAGNQSPPLEWTRPPKGTKELALIVEDPDAPSAEPFVHWMLWRVARNVRSLEAGTLPAGARQGTGDADRVGYFGPCPPPGPAHRYVFTLYALKKKLALADGAGSDEFRDAIEQARDRDRVLAQGTLSGQFARPSQ